MVNKTVYEWVRLSHHCRNLSSNSCKPFNAGIQKWGATVEVGHTQPVSEGHRLWWQHCETGCWLFGTNVEGLNGVLGTQ